jgi:hypothetical protein
MKQGTAADMIDFVHRETRNGHINAKTGSSIASAAARVLKRVYSDPSKVDIPSLDVEGTLKEFERRQRGLGEGTMQSYKARLRLAVRWYLAFLTDPATWQNSMASKSRTPGPAVTPVAEGFVDYQVPIRGATAHLILPRALTGGEADRLAAFVKTLVEEAI